MPTSRSLPSVVRLPQHRSVLRLADGSRIIGLDPESALVVDELPPALGEMLDELRMPSDPAGLVDRAVARGADARAAHDLLCELLDAGVLLDSTAFDRSEALRRVCEVLVEGSGPLTVGLISGLARAGLAVHVVTTGRVRAADLGTGFVESDCGLDRLGATRAVARRLVPTAQVLAATQRLAPDLVIFADETPTPERLATVTGGRHAHLLVRMRDGAGIVGPLVLPGRSACLACVELHRLARDGRWADVAAQLHGRAGTADHAALAATAALATAQALAALDGIVCSGGPPPTLGAKLEISPAAGTLTRREWAVAPACGCAASPLDVAGDTEERRAPHHAMGTQ
ncbi:hypothetical protein [Pseudonocardia sp. TRM90224]|uniref:hypothetical protein n=1 Tax=Pseudonocardia sp. TRM90224 TaxID=2812678 RepID=UPI001E46ADDE|nr:hypothetical protein [Pseudonocardia sp. TRM90224]